MTEESQKMDFTGERFVPGMPGNIALEHLHRYHQACEIAGGKVVLDIASGEGYGSEILASRAAKVFGIDISVEAVRHARKHYKRENLEYLAGSCADIPLSDASVDLVVSFETIEHHGQHHQMMQEIKRILRPSGVLLISSPDKYHYSEAVIPRYNNPYHVKELYQHEFKELLQNYFKNVNFFGQRIIYGSGILSESVPTELSSYQREHESIIEAAGMIKPVYWIALASDRQLPKLTSGILEQPIAESETVQSLGTIITARESEIANLHAQITDLSQGIFHRDAQIAALNQEVHDRDAQIVTLNRSLMDSDLALRRILASHSWRLTRPLRAIRSILIKNNEFARPSESPPEWFDSAWYLHSNPDVATNRIDPYKHYLIFGKQEGRLPGPEGRLKRARAREPINQGFPVALIRVGGFTGALRKTGRTLKHEGWSGLTRKILIFFADKLRPVELSKGFGRNDYTEWIRRYDTITDETRAMMRRRLDALEHKPLISIVMPTYNSDPQWLIEAIESVRKQIYPFWELCVADDASTDSRVRPILDRYVSQDPRVKVVLRPSNGHISIASNSALELATGEYVAFLDHDDLITEHALFWVAQTISQNPEAQIIYSDEDKIDITGQRSEPHFKSRWNRDLFYSQNMICHLGVYQTKLIRDLGGFREGFEGSQDYDLALRCIEKTDPSHVLHIPRVLYHWRVHQKSTASAGSAKPYALLAGEKALNEHLKRLGIDARAKLLSSGMYRIHYTIPAPAPMVSLIIPTRNGISLLRRCIESILDKTTYGNYEILVIDNASDDPETLRYIESLNANPRIRVIRDDRPFNFSALNNSAVKLARGELIGLVNNDIEVISPDWLSEMVSHALSPGVGAVGARLWYPNETLQHGGVVLGLGGGVAGHAHKFLPRNQPGYFGRATLTQSFSAVTAACLVIRKELFEQVGGLNETLQVAFNDVDLCLRVLEAGYRNVWTPYAELYHHESATRGYEDTPEKQARFLEEVQYMKHRWNRLLLRDPAYNPNLTLNHEDFSLAWPPRVDLL